MVVGLFGAGFPFVDGSPAAFGADEVLGGDLLGEHAVLIGAIAEDGEAAAVAHRNGESRMRERLPPVRVVDDVADGSLAVDGGDSPVEPDAIAWPAFVLAERVRGRADETAVRWEQDRRVWALPAELIDDVGGVAPVGVDQAAADLHGRSIVTLPFAAEKLIG